jgi:hypothetical protein
MYRLLRNHARGARVAELAAVEEPQVTGNRALDTVHLHLQGARDDFSVAMTRYEAEALAARLAAVVERTRTQDGWVSVPVTP